MNRQAPMTPRSFIAVLTPAVLLILAAARLHPTALGFLGIPALALTLLVGVGLALSSGQGVSNVPTSLLLLLLVTAAAATAFYWYRVWTYRNYDMGGIPLVLLYGVAFWWPGLFIAVASRLLETGLGPVPLREYLLRVGIGVLAGVVGSWGYRTADRSWYATRDRVALDDAIAALSPIVPGSGVGDVEWSLDGGILTLDVASPPLAHSAYHALRALDDGTSRVVDLLRRHDTDSLRFRVRTPDGDLLTLDAGKGVLGRDVWPYVRIDRSRLSAAGTLDTESLDDITWTTPSDFIDNARYDAFTNLFRAEAGRGHVRLAFPAAAAMPGDVDVHAAAWSRANRALHEVTRYFPDVERVTVEFPGLVRELGRDEFATVRSLQSLLLPGDRLLGLVVRRESTEAAELDPARFRSGEPLDGAQLAIRRMHGVLESHEAGKLFEETLIETGRLWVTAVAPDGRVTLFIAPWDGVPAGPLILGRGEQGELAGETVRNIGWLERRTFAGS